MQAESKIPPPEAPERLHRLGKYLMLAELGSGGMAEVYLAVTQGPAGFQKLRVIKLLRQELAENPHFVTMFLDEARLAARLAHPNIVQTNEVGEADGRFYIDMEYIEGQSLVSVMRRLAKLGRPMPHGLAARLLVEVLAGLQYAHEFRTFDGTPLKIVHRDVSPHNVLATFDGGVKLVDFGIAKIATQSHQTETGVIKGKVAYMAPEQTTAPQKADARVDIFAVGVMLFELLTSKRLWEGKTDTEILHALFRVEVPDSPRAVDPTVPEALDAITRRALAGDCAQRYASAAEMLQDLERYIDRSETKSGQRDVGAFMRETFDAERRALRAQIDGRLKKIELLGPSASLLDLHASNDSLSFSGVIGVGSTMTPSGSIDVRVGASGDRRVSTDERAALSLPDRSRTRTMFLFGGVAVAVVAAVAGIASRPPRAAPAAAQTSAVGVASWAAASASPQAAVAATREVRVAIRATPGDARLFLDDAELPRNPYEARVEQGPSTHRLRVEAPGHASRTVLVSFAEDVALDLRLEKTPEPARAASRGRAVEPPKKSPTTATAAPAPPPVAEAPKPDTAAAKTARELDESNPFR